MLIKDDEKVYEAQGKVKVLLTIMGDKAKIDGKLKISDSIEIDCEVRGQLDIGERLIIQKNGSVFADVKTVEAEIIGRYEGNMEATGNVEVMGTGLVSGNIKTDSLIINKGSVFSGTVTRISETADISKKKGKTITEEKTIEKPVIETKLISTKKSYEKVPEPKSEDDANLTL